VLNGTERTQRDNAFFTRPVTSQFDNICSSSYIRQKKKKLSVTSNVTFLKSFAILCAIFEMTDILNIKDETIFDDRIVKIETHTYNLFPNTTFGYSDEIRIPVQQQDLYTLPYESFLYVEGKLTKNKVVQSAYVTLGNNCVAFIFDEIRYELNSVEIDRNRNVGITNTLKNCVTVNRQKRDSVKCRLGCADYCDRIF